VIPDKTSNLAFLISGSVKQVAVHEGDHILADQTLVKLDTPDLEFAVAKAQADLVSAQAYANIVRQGRQVYVKRGQRWFTMSSVLEVRQQADQQVLQAQAALDIANGRLVQGSLAAPFDGTVVSINVNQGEMVQPQQVVAVIGDLDHLRLETIDLSEREIAKVQVSQAASVRLHAFNQQLPGHVVAIAPMATLYKGDMVYKVTIELDQQPAGLVWGMSGDVDIQTQ
jgi:RND family efflux transporter MFP subunit